MRLLVYSAFFEVCKTSKKLSTQGVLAQQGQIFRETENSRKGTFLRSFCFCKKNQKARAACFLGRGRAPTPREMPQAAEKQRSGALLRGLQNLISSRKGTVLFFSLLRKEPKVAQRVATLWTPRDGSKLYRIFFRVASVFRP